MFINCDSSCIFFDSVVSKSIIFFLILQIFQCRFFSNLELKKKKTNHSFLSWGILFPAWCEKLLSDCLTCRYLRNRANINFSPGIWMTKVINTEFVILYQWMFSLCDSVNNDSEIFWEVVNYYFTMALWTSWEFKRQE